MENRTRDETEDFVRKEKRGSISQKIILTLVSIAIIIAGELLKQQDDD